jgi:hypothetical protein
MRSNLVAIKVSDCHLISVICEYGVGAVPLRDQRHEGRQDWGAKVAVDPDRIQDGHWDHGAVVECWQVNPNHLDRVTARLTPTTCRQ